MTQIELILSTSGQSLNKFENNVLKNDNSLSKNDGFSEWFNRKKERMQKNVIEEILRTNNFLQFFLENKFKARTWKKNIIKEWWLKNQILSAIIINHQSETLAKKNTSEEIFEDIIYKSFILKINTSKKLAIKELKLILLLFDCQHGKLRS